MQGLQRDVILVFGKTGSGKTEWVKRFLADRHRVLICDADQRGYDAVHFESFDGLVDYAEDLTDPRSFYRLSYTPYEHEFPEFLDLGRILSPVHLVLEEADRFPDPSECFEYQEIVVRGRHSSTSLVAVSLYPFLMPKMLRSQATRIIAFRQHEPADIDWLRRVMGDDARALSNLGDHEFFDWTPGTRDFVPQRLDLKRGLTIVGPGSKLEIENPTSSEGGSSS